MLTAQEMLVIRLRYGLDGESPKTYDAILGVTRDWQVNAKGLMKASPHNRI